MLDNFHKELDEEFPEDRQNIGEFHLDVGSVERQTTDDEFDIESYLGFNEKDFIDDDDE